MRKLGSIAKVIGIAFKYAPVIMVAAKAWEMIHSEIKKISEDVNEN